MTAAAAEARIRVLRRRSRWRFWDWDKRTVFEVRVGDAPAELIEGAGLGGVARECVQTALYLSLAGDRSSWVACPSGAIIAEADGSDPGRPTGQAALDARRAKQAAQDRVMIPLLGFGAAAIMLIVLGVLAWSTGGTAGFVAYSLTVLAAAASGFATLTAASFGPKWMTQLAFWAVPAALPVVMSLDGYALGWLFGHLLGLALAAAMRRRRSTHNG